MDYATIIIGAGAAGLHCAAQALGGGSVLVVDHAKNPGEKIRISGGGRCNFTNIYTGPENFLSHNPHFAKSALARYSANDFIDLVERYGISYHEKTLGQLFCDNSAKDIIRMLLAEANGAEILLQTSVVKIEKTGAGFAVSLSDNNAHTCKNLVIATGGKSIPKMGASGFGYQVAQQFGVAITDTRAGLVPFTFGAGDLAMTKPLSGVSLSARVTCHKTGFKEALLFTHRGLSGPAILQISNYWREKDQISINLLPDQDAFELLRQKRGENGRRSMSNLLAELLPKRLAEALARHWRLNGNIADQSDKSLKQLAEKLQNWRLTPTGTEGYRTAEVTLGGIDTDALNASTMECKTVPGLYFIGEVVDVTGWLGGYNFQWAWASAFAAGRAIAEKSSLIEPGLASDM